MQEIFERVYIANELSCRAGGGEWAVVHACKSPCHQKAVGYRGNLSGTHPNYLVLKTEHDLYLNIIDPPVPLFKPPLFTEFLSFAQKLWNEGKKLLIHCNQGESRAPSLAMLFLAKCAGAISDKSYELAKADFMPLYPVYKPGKGIQIYLTRHWNVLNGFQRNS